MGWLMGGAFLVVILFLAYLFNKLFDPDEEHCDGYIIPKTGQSNGQTKSGETNSATEIAETRVHPDHFF